MAGEDDSKRTLIVGDDARREGMKPTKGYNYHWPESSCSMIPIVKIDKVVYTV